MKQRQRSAAAHPGGEHDHEGRGRRRDRRGSHGRALIGAPLLALAMLVLFVLAPAVQAASPYARTIRDGRAAARELLAQTGAPSLSLALVSNGKVVWRQGFGYADVAKKAAPTADTRYGLGSVSKTVATVALMQLVDDGLVDLDAPVVAYLPDFRMASHNYRDVTVRMLLDHSSGFPGSAYGSAMGSEYWPGYLDQVLGTLAISRLKSTPGAVSVYCNDGFTLLEGIIASASGKSFTEYVEDEVLEPLGMTRSAYPTESFADGSYAKAYGADGSANPREVVNALASGGLYSTPSEMARLATMFMNRGAYAGRQILSPAAVREMGADQTIGEVKPALFKGARYGLGWDSVTQPGLLKAGFTAWMKGGDSSDYHAGFIVVPGKKLAVIVQGVAPLDSGKAETLGERILLHALVDRGALRRMPAEIPAASPRAKAASESQLGAIRGFWAGNSMVFKAESGADPQSVTISWLGHDGAWNKMVDGLRMRTDGRFHHTGSAASVWVASAAGRRYLVNRQVSGNGFCYDDLPLAQKIRPGEPLSVAWSDRVGEWWLGVDEHPASAFWSDGGPLLHVGDVQGLQGYVTVDTPTYGMQIVDPGEDDSAGLMFLQIPGFGSRDMNDLVVEERGGEEWMRYGSTLYRPLATVPELAAGDNIVSTDGDGDAEWRVLPAASQVTIDAGSMWILYDADLSVVDRGGSYPAEITADAGGYLCLFAPAGTNAGVHVTPSVKGAPAPERLRAPRLPDSTPSLEDLTTPAR